MLLFILKTNLLIVHKEINQYGFTLSYSPAVHAKRGSTLTTRADNTAAPLHY